MTPQRKPRKPRARPAAARRVPAAVPGRSEAVARALVAVGRELAETLDPAVVGERIVQSLRDLVGARSAVLYRLLDTGELVVLASAGGVRAVLAPGQRLPPGTGLGGLAMRERGPVRTSDASRDAAIRYTPELRAAMGSLPDRSLLGIPLVARGRVIGALTVGDREAREYDAEAVALAEAFADQAAVALDSAQSHADMRARMRELGVLIEVNRVVTSSLEIGRVTGAVLEAALALVGDGVAHLWEADEASEILTLVAWRAGTEVPIKKIPLGSGILGQVAASRTVMLCPDIPSDRRIINRYWFDAERIQSGIVLPLLFRDQLYGILSLFSRGPLRDDAEHLRLLQSLADQGAVALANARLFAQSERRRIAAETLTEVGHTLSQSRAPSEVGERSLTRARALLGAEIAAIYLLEEGTGDLVLFDARGFDGPTDWNERLPRGSGLAGLVIAEGRPVSSPDILADPRVFLTADARARVERSSFRSLLAVPIAVAGRRLGTLNIGGQAGRRFNDEEVQVAQGLADQIAISLENARLYAEAERRREEAQKLAEVAGTLTESLDLSAVAERIASTVLALFQARSSSLRVVREDGTVEALAWGGRARQFFAPGYLVPPGQGMVGRAIAAGRAVWTADSLAEPELQLDEHVRRRVAESGDVAFLAIPLRRAGATVGVITVADDAGRMFTPAEIALLQAFADQAAVALDNARLFGHALDARSAAQASEEALRESETRYRSLFDGMPVGLYRCGPDGAMIAVNPAMVQMLGYGDTAALLALDGRSHYPHPEERREMVRIATREGIVRDFAARMRRRDGTVIWTRNTIRVVRDASGAVVSFEGTVEDITEARRAEETRAGLEEQLRQAQKMEAVGRLAGGIAHDFNNLLTVITGRSDLLLGRLPADDPIRANIALIERTAQRAAELTRQLLAFSRKQVLQPRLWELRAVVAELAPMLRRIIGEDVEMATVAGAEPEWVRADRGQLEQVIVNLAVNARDAMPRGGRLTLATGVASDRVVLAVSDTGLGIPEDVRSRIFEPFFTTKEVGKGTGLGLAVVYGIVQQHEGTIEVDSAVGQGTTFRISLPRAAAPALPTDGAPAAAERPRVQGTVLLVEDEPEVRELAAEVLGAIGCTVLTAPSAADALAMADKHAGRIDLLLTDVVMPGMNGRELAERLRARRPDVRVLYMSGYPDSAFGADVESMRGRTLLEKPFAPSSLISKVRESLTGDSSRVDA